MKGLVISVQAKKREASKPATNTVKKAKTEEQADDVGSGSGQGQGASGAAAAAAEPVTGGKKRGRPSKKDVGFAIQCFA